MRLAQLAKAAKMWSPDTRVTIVMPDKTEHEVSHIVSTETRIKVHLKGAISKPAA